MGGVPCLQGLLRVGVLCMLMILLSAWNLLWTLCARWLITFSQMSLQTLYACSPLAGCNSRSAGRRKKNNDEVEDGRVRWLSGLAGDVSKRRNCISSEWIQKSRQRKMWLEQWQCQRYIVEWEFFFSLYFGSFGYLRALLCAQFINF